MKKRQKKNKCCKCNNKHSSSNNQTQVPLREYHLDGCDNGKQIRKPSGVGEAQRCLCARCDTVGGREKFNISAIPLSNGLATGLQRHIYDG
jgi:hypothetical protein